MDYMINLVLDHHRVRAYVGFFFFFLFCISFYWPSALLSQMKPDYLKEN